jgi:hypothetical protein
LQKRPAAEIRSRCSSILTDKTVVGLVLESSSPTAAYDRVLEHTKDAEKAKAARWLAVLRRDYPDVFSELTKTE